MGQIAFPTEVAPHEIARKTSLGAAFELCAEVGGLEPKEILSELRLDKAQWSRWVSGGEGVVWPKFVALMDLCGHTVIDLAEGLRRLDDKARETAVAAFAASLLKTPDA